MVCWLFRFRIFFARTMESFVLFKVRASLWGLLTAWVRSAGGKTDDAEIHVYVLELA